MGAGRAENRRGEILASSRDVEQDLSANRIAVVPWSIPMNRGINPIA